MLFAFLKALKGPLKQCRHGNVHTDTRDPPGIHAEEVLVGTGAMYLILSAVKSPYVHGTQPGNNCWKGMLSPAMLPLGVLT